MADASHSTMPVIFIDCKSRRDPGYQKQVSSALLTIFTTADLQPSGTVSTSSSNRYRKRLTPFPGHVAPRWPLPVLDPPSRSELPHFPNPGIISELVVVRLTCFHSSFFLPCALNGDSVSWCMENDCHKRKKKPNYTPPECSS